MPGEPIETEDGKLLTTRIISSLTTITVHIRNVMVGVNPITGDEMKDCRRCGCWTLEAKSTSETRANEQQAVLMSVLQESEPIQQQYPLHSKIVGQFVEKRRV